MINRDDTLRAMLAVRTNDASHFHGDLNNYVLQVLESLDMPPIASELKLLHKEVSWVVNCVPLAEIQQAIDEVFEDCIDTPVTEEDEPLYQPNNLVTNIKLKDWHLNALSICALISFIVVFIKVS
tara:strand:+ start:11106 stop:11480 length:375 start_codon:yes stop_codon:yes gene_type:complete